MTDSKVMSAAEAVAQIKDGDIIAVGSTALQGEPMVLVREIIRQKKKNLFLVPTGSSAISGDLLVGTGCVTRVVSSSVGFMRYGAIGPRFRLAVEQGKITLWECEQSQKLSALRAATRGLPFMPTIIGVGADYAKVNPNHKLFKDPIKGEQNLMAVAAIEPDVMLVTTVVADRFGNAQHGGVPIYDVLGSRAAKKVIVLTEEVVRPEYITANPHKTTILSYNVCAVVEAPYAAHPASNHGCYRYDSDHIKEYLKLARTEEGFQAYLQNYVLGPKDHTEYLERIGLRTLLNIKTPRG